jgi:short-subunit dehydrogenase
MDKRSFDDRVVWITGASAGIGEVLARKLSEEGACLALSARREGKLDQVHADCSGGPHRVLPVDVTDRERMATVADEIIKEFGQLDCVVFNAGVFGTLGNSVFDADVYKRNMNVNYMGIVHGIEVALPHLRDSDAGYVVGMSSAAAYTPMARGSAYGSSKTAVKYLLDSLDHEWEQKGVDVDVSVVCPGVVRTPMTEDENFPYEPPPSFLEVSPEWAGGYILNQMKNRTHEIRFPFFFVLLLKFLGILPNPPHRWLLQLMDRMNVKERFRP